MDMKLLPRILILASYQYLCEVIHDKDIIDIWYLALMIILKE